MSLRSHWGLAVAALAGAIALPGTGAAQSAAQRPALVVFLTVDQMRPDYFDRWAGQLTGGLARLSRQGAFFTNAFQDHAVTETAPGHSVTMSGRFPRSTGILRNADGSRGSASAPADLARPGCVALPIPRLVADRLDATARLRSRALSISRKDRGAILPLGRAKQSVFWYATSNGEFTTSRYYADTLPTWIRRVNARRVPQTARGPALVTAASCARVCGAGQRARRSMPVATSPSRTCFSTDTARAASEFPSTPFMDRLTLDAALEGLQALDLGRGPQTDLLAVSLSATDYIGHRYGPESREQHDNMLRLDRSLGVFIDSLYRLRDSSTIVFALTADHGVTSFPELVAQRSGRTAPPRYNLTPPVTELRNALRQAGVDEQAVTFDGSLVIVDRSAFARASVNPDPLLARFAAAMRRRPGIVARRSRAGPRAAATPWAMSSRAAGCTWSAPTRRRVRRDAGERAHIPPARRAPSMARRTTTTHTCR